jgi:maltose O-acetyltransferase
MCCWPPTCRSTPRIGDDCWIGGGAIICPGVTIGPRSIIGAGAVVTRDIPADSVAVGNPAKVIRTLKQDEERCWELAQ